MSRSSNTFPVPRTQHPWQRERDPGGCRYRFPLRGWALGSEAFSGFRIQLYAPEIHSREVQPVPTCSEQQGLRGKDSVFLAGGEAVATCTTRTSTTPKRTARLAQGKDMEDLALPRHFSLGSLRGFPRQLAGEVRRESQLAGDAAQPRLPGAMGSPTQQTSLPRS